MRWGYQPSGSPDPSVAMACDELLVHAADARRGLGLDFPAAGLAARVLRRLFPWHEAGPDPWETLLRANGRLERAGRPSQHGWVWHAAPLSEWDGAPSASPLRSSGELFLVPLLFCQRLDV